MNMDNNDCRGLVAIGTAASNRLIAGAPKQGKSTAVGIIVDRLKNCPKADGIRIISIDTAKPHLDADETLASLCRELERREDLRNVGVDISGFPMIVAVVDEYSDLMDFGSRDFRRAVKDYVLRIAKEGPEVGMRMILSTRRPAQEMKALLEHFPTRMVFRVSDRKDSKMLLKSEAAFWELNGNGEMVLYDKGIISQCNITSFIQ